MQPLLQKYELPTIWRLTSAGSVQAYESRVEGDKVLRWTWTEPTPKLGRDGKIVPAKKQPIKSAKEPLTLDTKWVGNANEKTPHEAAITKAKSEWKKKLDRGYTEKKPEMIPVPYKAPKKRISETTTTEKKPKEKKIPARALKELETPMLLQKFDKDENPLPKRACISVKRNGACGFYRRNDNLIVSRRNIAYEHFDHLKEGLGRIVDIADAYLISKGYKPRDNDVRIVKAIHMELDLPDELQLTFQNKMSILRSEKTPHALAGNVMACIFDLGDQHIVPFHARYAALVHGYETWRDEMRNNNDDHTHIRLVRCYAVDDDVTMYESLEAGEADEWFQPRTWDSFYAWLIGTPATGGYDGHTEKWETIEPLSVTSFKAWLSGEEEIDREARIRLLHRWFVDFLGEEGSVIRDLDGFYAGNDYRSDAVLKYKDYEDEEAVVVGYECATGAQIGAIIFVLRSLTTGVVYNSVFSAEYGADLDARRALFNDYDTGKISLGSVIYTVRFQERHDSGVPQFPTIVGECPADSKTINGCSLDVLAKEQYAAHIREQAAEEEKKRLKEIKKAASAAKKALKKKD